METAVVESARDAYRERRRSTDARRVWNRIEQDHPDIAAEVRSALLDRGIGSPSWCVPYRCWERWDTPRVLRGQRTGLEDADPEDEQRYTSLAIAMLAEDASEAYSVVKTASRTNQLEHCRWCGSRLRMLARDEDGYVMRDQGRQPEYCSAGCKREQRNKVRRHRTRSRRDRRPQFGCWGVSSYIRAEDDWSLPKLPDAWDRVTVNYFYPGPIGSMQYAGLEEIAANEWRISYQ